MYIVCVCIMYKMCVCVCAQDHEISMLGEVTHLQSILEDLTHLTAEPTLLPPASEQVHTHTHSAHAHIQHIQHTHI